MNKTDWEAFARRLMDRVERDGNGLHLSSIVDEGLAFDARRGSKELVVGGTFSEVTLKKIADYLNSRYQKGSNGAARSWGGGGGRGDAGFIDIGGINIGVDLAHGVDGTVISCIECGTRYGFHRSEKMPATCRCCGAPFEGKEIGT